MANKKVTVADFLKYGQAAFGQPKEDVQKKQEAAPVAKPTVAPTPAVTPKPAVIQRPPSIPTPMTGTTEQTKVGQRDENDIMRSIVEQSIRQKVGDTLDADAVSLLARRQLEALKAPQTDSEAQVRQAISPIIEEQRRQAKELEQRIEQERLERMNERERLLQKYEERLQRESEMAERQARQAAGEQMAITERTLGARGALTGTPGQQQLSSIQANLDDTLGAIQAAKNYELRVKEAELSDMDAEALGAMKNTLSRIRENADAAQLELEKNIADLKMQAAELGNQQELELLQNLIDQYSVQKVQSEFDKNLTTTIGDGYIYGTGADGTPSRLKDAEGNFLTYNTGDELDIISGMPGSLPAVSPMTQQILQNPELLKQLDADARVNVIQEAAEAGYDLGSLTRPATAVREEIRQSDELVDLIDSIESSETLGAAVGPISRWLPSAKTIFGEETTGDFKRDVERLKNLLTIDNLSLMSGVLSESDIKILQSAGTNLDLGMSEGKFKEELSRIKDSILKSQYDMLGIQDRTFEQAKNEVGEEALRRAIKAGIEDLELETQQSFSQPLSMGVKGSVSSIKDGSKVDTKIGKAIATGIEQGSRMWQNGLDMVLEGGYGAPVKAPFSGKVTFAGQYQGFGNQVRVQLGDGREIWLSHLKDINVKPGDNIKAGITLGTQGNTGNVIGSSGESLTSTQKAAGRGTHLDITVKNPDGSFLSSQQVAQLINTQLA